MRPETLEQCLTWIAARDAILHATKHFAEIELPSEDGDGVFYADTSTINGDIPAAVIAATQQVWDQVNGEAK